MSDFEKSIIADLAKKYTFENFDFKNKTPEELILEFQNNFSKIEKVVDDQNSKIAEESLHLFLNS